MAADLPFSGRAALVLLVASAACVGPTEHADAFDSLVVGSRVEAQGPPGPGIARARKLRELAPDPRAKGDKVEVTAPIGASDEQGATLLGRRFEIVAKTAYEDADKRKIGPFPLAPGRWVKVKGRLKSGNRLQARTIRLSEPRDHFTVEGTLTELEAAARRLQIGSVPVAVPRGARIDLLHEGRGRESDDPLALFLADDQKAVPFSLRLTDSLRLGGSFVTRVKANDEFDFDRSRDRDRSSLRVEGKLDLLWRLDEAGSFAFLEGTAGRRDRFKDGAPDTTTEPESLSRGYAYFKLADTVRAIVGRQDFDEEREWLFDEVLDGVRLRWMPAPFEFEVAAAYGREFLEENNETDNTATFLALGRYHVDKHHRVTAYVIQRKDTNARHFEPLLVGIRSWSRPWKGLGHWVELSHATGFLGRRRIEGVAADLGLIYRFGGALHPAITAGWAFGSGKSAASGEVGFRQTGLQDNNGRFGGVTSFRYYGEVMDPELANLVVTTVGFGVRPARAASADVVLHTYRQDVARAELGRNDIRAKPNGRFRGIGWEADVILGYRVRHLNLEIIFARLDPGAAFDGTDTAHKAQFQMRVKF